MDAWRPSDDAAVVAALDAALSPYRWRRFTAERLARIALAARDRQELRAVLAEVEGAAVGAWVPLEPADRADARVPRVVAGLAGLRWAEATLAAACRALVGALGPGPEQS